MKKIEFINDSAPYLSAENLNLLQDNVEEAIAEFYNEKTKDTGWVKLNDVVKYRKIGNVVTVVADSRGTQTLIKDDYTNVGTLPSNVRPSLTIEFPWTRIGEGDVGLTMIGTDGNIKLFSTSGTGYWGFTTTYLVD